MRWIATHSRAPRTLKSMCSRHQSDVARRFVLRPYQEQCLDACLDAVRSGCTRIGVSLPTGSGKTTVFISLLSRIPAQPSSPEARRALIVVNSVELARQSADQVRTLFPDWSVEIEQGLKHKASGLADVTVATYQTLIKGDRIFKFDRKFLKAVIVDEAHHAAAPSYRRLLSHFNPLIKNPDDNYNVKSTPLPHPIPIIGFSATFSRHDGLALGAVFERIVYHRDFLAMIKEHWLCNVRFTSVRAKLDLDQVTVNSRTGEFNPTSLAHVINTDTVNNLVVQTWLDRAVTRRSTLVFCVNIEHVRALTEAFRSFGVDARYIYSRTPAQERKTLLASFKSGEFPVLINCAILTEGADIPNIDCVVVARPTRSRNVFAQMIGRGMRLSPDTGKSDCRIIDFVDSTARVSGVVCIPTLFGLDPNEVDIDDESLETLEKRQEKVKSDAVSTFDTADSIPDPKSVTYTDYENPFALVNDSSGSPHVTSMSPYAWVCCGSDIYVLECLGKGHIRIEPITKDGEPRSQFRAFYTPANLDRSTAAKFKVSPFYRSREILTANGLMEAIKGCDTYARAKVVHGPMVAGLLRSAKWRKGPATDNQKNFIGKRWRPKFSAGEESDKELAPDVRFEKLTKGQAANIITRIKHGALARYNDKVKAVKKLVQVHRKEHARRAREDVQVGPLS